jgi:hypothetical protein
MHHPKAIKETSLYELLDKRARLKTYIDVIKPTHSVRGLTCLSFFSF